MSANTETATEISRMNKKMESLTSYIESMGFPNAGVKMLGRREGNSSGQFSDSEGFNEMNQGQEQEEKESSIASSQSTKGKKRNRGDGHSISSQRRHSTRNPRIGLGFRNEPDNPVQIVDNDEAAVVGDKGREGTGDILSADSLKILIGPLLPFGEGRIILDSVYTDDTLARLRKVYRILDVIRLSLPLRGT
ncbi:hypothetical protein LWI29_018259 [Acer saccharum]|uniref:Uncharacterized protein n=1 Tax=Acer saccharum TaxID=4024 RepID=A0AA39W8M4_ACESA|nr:hypothetical protein LWI29_018259 [Acer saccharum]